MQGSLSVPFAPVWRLGTQVALPDERAQFPVGEVSPLAVGADAVWSRRRMKQRRWCFAAGFSGSLDDPEAESGRRERWMEPEGPPAGARSEWNSRRRP